MIGSLVFLTPSGGLVMLALVIPLAGLSLAARREREARRALRLDAPPPVSQAKRAAALIAVPLILGIAATQPALRSTESARVRTDAQAFFVVDITRSMLASSKPGAQTRLQRAKADALALRDAIPQVPSGIATLTDRVIPELFPTVDRNVFGDTLAHAVSIEEPPPISSDILATNVGAIGELGTQNYFGPAAKRRVVIVLTDGESGAYDPGTVAHDLATGPGAKLVLVRTSAPNETVYDSNGQAEVDYHPQLDAPAQIAALMGATGGHSFGEGSLGAAAHAIEADLGTGPTVVRGTTERTQTLAPYVALLALLPLLLVLPRVGRGLGSALRTFGAAALESALGRIRQRRDYSAPKASPPVARPGV